MNPLLKISRIKQPLLAVLILVSLFLMAGKPAETQDRNASARIKAMFVYNFSKYVEWPQSYKSGSFVIGVLGDTPLQPELNKMAEAKKAVTQPFEIKRFNNVDDIEKCHMIFISKANSSSLSSVLTKVKGYSTLVVTEKEGLAKQGAGVNFVTQDNKQRFEISRKNLEKSGLKVSESLISLAIQV